MKVIIFHRKKLTFRFMFLTRRKGVGHTRGDGEITVFGEPIFRRGVFSLSNNSGPINIKPGRLQQLQIQAAERERWSIINCKLDIARRHFLAWKKKSQDGR